MSFGRIFKDKEGKTITRDEWSALIEKGLEYSAIKQENVGHYFVSTVWLGLAHVKGNFFETMIFRDGEEDPLDQKIYRYGSLEEAKEGHLRVVSAVNEYIKTGKLPE